MSQTQTKMSDRGLALLKKFEGCRLETYICAAGVNTIGFGRTKGVKPGMKITIAKAEDFLREDLTEFEKAIADSVKIPLNQNQFDALTSLIYNIGVSAFFGSTLLKKLNAGDYAAASNQFLRWNKAAGRELQGLSLRRQAEKELFDTPVQEPKGGKSVLYVKSSTLLKRSPVQSSELNKNEKALIGPGSALPLLAYKQEGDHIKATLEKKFAGIHDWWIYLNHVEIVDEPSRSSDGENDE